jgi:hypothetical protein
MQHQNQIRKEEGEGEAGGAGDMTRTVCDRCAKQHASVMQRDIYGQKFELCMDCEGELNSKIREFIRTVYESIQNVIDLKPEMKSE